ncbi:uracil-DNA glycosylase [Pelistega europaea]|uniref:Uracil-DNA glycosylase n=1 Tax=Pelistega europaea TaxID=106147 RepID=A0A7Y4P5W0_9BURK|nr:uracil-DNA glycosylase [Pelistega europaea]NOL50188.1 uracil-DNA glycosylase [Pelistega europaea]
MNNFPQHTASNGLSLSSVQVLWLKELGVTMLWGRELQENKEEPVASEAQVNLDAATSQQTTVTTPLGAIPSSTLATSTAISAEVVSSEKMTPAAVAPNQTVAPSGVSSVSDSEVSLIKRGSPEGRVKAGRPVSQEQARAIQTIQKGFEQLSRQSYRTSSPAQPGAMPTVQVNSWDELVQSVCHQYLQWGWVQDEREVLVGQEGKKPLDILIIEEMPGAEDALEGQVFAGASGKLLANMLAPLGVAKNDVAITSLFKFHARDENIPVSYAIPYLQAQIQLLQPKCIWLLGTRAAQSFLQQDNSTMDGLRMQEWFYPLNETQKIPVIVSHHPSLLLINPSLKADIWTDLQKILPYIKG